MLALAKVAALTIFTIVVGGRTIPWLLTRVSRTQSRELFTLAVLVTALGIAVAAAEVFGVSMALGAFLAGLVVGRSEFSVRAAADALPMRDAFAVLFFVSVGMLLNPGAMLATPALFLATLAVILVGKPLAAFAIVRLLRYPMSTALAVAVALAQIGEFSFIVATLGNQLGILSVEATNTIVGASIVSIILNPVLYRALESWGGRATARTTAVEHEPLAPMAAPLSADHRAVIVGYGPIGRAVARLLRDNEIAPTVVEMNIDTMRELRAEGIDAVHGDATRPEVLAAARVGQAGSFIVSAAGLADAGGIVPDHAAAEPTRPDPGARHPPA